MLKIYGYECRRLLGGKAFLGMAAVTLWYALQLLRGTVIWGIAHTAPFSPWSFGYYLAALLPFLCGVGLLLLTGFFEPSAQQTLILVRATPIPPWQYALARCGVVASGLGLAGMCVVGMGVLFMENLFGPVPLAGYGQVAVLTLLPLPVLVLGLGMALGNWGTAPLYGLAAVLFLLPGLSGRWEPTGLVFFREFPAALGILDPPLQIPPSLWWSRALVLLTGLLLLGVGAVKQHLRFLHRKH